MRWLIRSASCPEILNRCTKRCAMSCALCACLILRSQVAALADDRATSQHLIPRPSSPATKSIPATVRRSAWELLLTIAGLSAREMADASQFMTQKYCAVSVPRRVGLPQNSTKLYLTSKITPDREKQTQNGRDRSPQSSVRRNCRMPRCPFVAEGRIRCDG